MSLQHSSHLLMLSSLKYQFCLQGNLTKVLLLRSVYSKIIRLHDDLTESSELPHLELNNLLRDTYPPQHIFLNRACLLLSIKLLQQSHWKQVHCN